MSIDAKNQAAFSAREIHEFERVWNSIPAKEWQRIDQLVAHFAPTPGVLLYENEDDDADDRLDHYAMPPLSENDGKVLFADLPLGSFRRVLQ